VGRHSAGDDDAAEAPTIVAPETPAVRRGRHSRSEDDEDTGPLPGGLSRPPAERAAAQDEQPTELLRLDALRGEALRAESRGVGARPADAGAADDGAADDAGLDELLAGEPEEAVTAELPVHPPEPAPEPKPTYVPEPAPGVEPESGTEPEPRTQPAAAAKGTAQDASPPTGSAAEPAGRPARTGHSTGEDLALLRSRPDVRNRVIAAVVVPFVLYVAVMLVLGAPPARYLIWIWIPLISAGVLAGLILDAAHRSVRPKVDAGRS
jgi:hypothetical protein